MTDLCVWDRIQKAHFTVSLEFCFQMGSTVYISIEKAENLLLAVRCT